MACSSIIVGKNASVTGSIIVARNEDFPTNNWAKHMVIRPATSNQVNATFKFGNGLTIPAPSQTLSYTALPDWNADSPNNTDGPFEEVGCNSYNVVISATTSAETSEKVQQLCPFNLNGIVESVIPTLLLSQATTARQAVILLGQYIDKYGAGESNGIIIADINEVWHFEIGSSQHWLAIKIPDDSYVFCANRLRISGIDLADVQNVISSHNLFDFVVNNNLLDQADFHNFNFAKAFAPLDLELYNTDREWFALNSLTPSKSFQPRAQQYPFIVKADKKISVQDIATILRNADYKGTVVHEDFTRELAVERNLETHIIELRSNMPKQLAVLNWQSFGPSKDSIFTPLYLGAMTKIPNEYQIGTNQYDPISAWWTFRTTTTLTNANPEKYRPLVHDTRKKHEAELFQQQLVHDKELCTLYQNNNATAIEQASEYSYQSAIKTLQIHQQLNSQIMTDLTKSTELEYTAEEFEKIKNL